MEYKLTIPPNKNSPKRVKKRLQDTSHRNDRGKCRHGLFFLEEPAESTEYLFRLLELIMTTR
jgi:hypothetical protein